MEYPVGLKETKEILPNLIKLIINKNYTNAIKLLNNIIKNTVHKSVYYMVVIMKTALMYENKSTYRLAIKILNDMKYSLSAFGYDVLYKNMLIIEFPQEIVDIMEKYKHEDNFVFLYFMYLHLIKSEKDMIEYYTDMIKTDSYHTIYTNYLGILTKKSPEFFLENLCSAEENECYCENNKFILYIVGMIHQYVEFDYGESEKCFKKIIKYYPDTAWAHMRLGILYYTKFNSFEKGSMHLNIALKDDPENPIFLYEKACISSEDDSIEYLQKSILIDPNFKLGIEKYSNQEISMNKKVDLFMKLLIIDPVNTDIIIKLANIYAGKESKNRIKLYTKLYNITKSDIVLKYIEKARTLLPPEEKEIILFTPPIKN